jgi:hypothetical protein
MEVMNGLIELIKLISEHVTAGGQLMRPNLPAENIVNRPSTLKRLHCYTFV